MIPKLRIPVAVPIPTGKGDGYVYLLLEDWVYAWEKGGKKYRWTIPRGFLFDGASIPRLVWTLSGYTPDGLWRGPSLAHDLGYHLRGDIPGAIQQVWDGFTRVWRPCPAVWSRRDLDRLFARLLREAGTTERTRRRMFISVRCFGWMPWYFGRDKVLVLAPVVQEYLALYPQVGCAGLTAG